MLDEDISEEELRRAKLSLKTSWSFSFEKPFNIGYAFASWHLMGRPEVAERYLSKMEALKASHAGDFLRKYYSKDAVSSAALLPEDE